MSYFKKNPKKILILISCVVVVILATIGTMIFLSAPKPSETFAKYQDAWQNKDYKTMYSLLSNEAKNEISEEDFVTRYQNVFEGIEANNIEIQANDGEEAGKTSGDNSNIAFSVVMDTLAGNVKISDYNMQLVKEKIDGKKVWTVNWDEKLIFPKLEKNDKVRVNTIRAQRGQILDRNGNALAKNGTLNTIIIIPSKFNAVKDTALPEIAKILDMSQDKIEGMLKSSTNPDWAVPIVTLSATDKEKATKLTAIDGIQYQKSQGRVYPGGEAFGNLIGYIGSITAEELEDHKEEGYTSSDKIGKLGLEQVYEKKLKGENGGEIYIAKGGNETDKETIAKKDSKDGEDIKLSIDMNTQNEIYSKMNKEAGAAAACNPKTGEILALVSSPSFDSNLYSTYIPDSLRDSWKTGKDPFTNRFKAVYAPGSTFKLVTGAIGLKNGTINPSEAVEITGTQWQPNSSWGNNKVTRVDDIGRPVNLQDAYVYSDNIYFAMQALKIGKDKFTEEAKNFGIGEQLPIEYPFADSKLSNDGLNSEQLLADTGYGQGEVQVSPLNVALFYSALANNGDIMTPILELNSDNTTKVWKEKAIAADNVKTLTDDLIQVVENPAGTAYTNPAGKTRILGKTGTAELKKSQEDTAAEENGWFVAMNVDNPKLVVAMIMEDVKTKGGSHHLVPIVKSIFDDIIK